MKAKIEMIGKPANTMHEEGCICMEFNANDVHLSGEKAVVLMNFYEAEQIADAIGLLVDHFGITQERIDAEIGQYEYKRESEA